MKSLSYLLALSALLAPTATAQFKPAPRANQPEIGIGVDTLPNNGWAMTWRGATAEIYRRWSEFLASPAPRYTAPGDTPSPYWSLAEQRRFVTFPIALNLSGDAGATTVLDIRPAAQGSDSVFIVKTLFSSRDRKQPFALVRVYAVREANRWVFSNALPRTTRGWKRVVRGPFTYVMPGNYPFNARHADLAVAFADSVARAFAVPAIHDVEYYLTESVDDMNRIVGLDWLPSASTGGGFSMGAGRLIVSGDPGLGENYRHEIVHVVLRPFAERSVQPILWEGIATWLGGTLGMNYPDLRRSFAAYLRAHPTMTLDSAIAASVDRGFRPAGAVLIGMAFERGGTKDVKNLLSTPGASDLRAALTKHFGMTWPALSAVWRRAATR